MSDFNKDYPVSFAQARRGEVIVTQGYGKPTRVWRPCSIEADACHSPWKVSGTPAPATAPTITKSEEITYYVARIDILNAGSNIDLPPFISIDVPTPPEGYVGEGAEAVARIQQEQLNEIEVTAFGRHYTKAPVVFASSEPVDVDTPENTDPNGGDGLDLYFYTYPALDTENGGNDVNADNYSYLYAVQIRNKGERYSTGNSIDYKYGEEGYGNPPQFQCTSLIRGQQVCSTACFIFGVETKDGKVERIEFGGPWKCDNGDGNRPDGTPLTGGYPRDFRYQATTIQNQISWQQKRDIAPPGGSAAFGQLQAIMRATLRGKYQCYYRFINDTVPKDEGGPLYSNLSPVTEIDTDYGCASITWELPDDLVVPENCKIELWRSSANQATTLFKVKTLAGDARTFFDDLNDHELTDAKRKETNEWDEFAALPILLPNGELNANRFGVMSDDFAVAVMFQDRLWYGVDTTNNRPNSLMFSETDEPESCPDVNEIIIQQNLRSADYITALIPYAGALIACQSRHSHRLTYVSQPLIDVSTFLLAYRGCCNQRTWDIYEGVAYIMDDQGVYSLDPQGKLEPLTVGIDDLFQDKINWDSRQWFIVRADRRLNVLRCLVSFKGDEGKYPTRQLCYSFDYKAWWVEVYPQALVGSTDCRGKSGNVERIWGGEKGRFYRLGQGLTDEAEGAITSVNITNPGRGYKSPPTVTASGGSCAEFSASINADGQVTGIQVRQCGSGYTNGSLNISLPEGAGTPATATYTVQNNKTPIYYSFQSGNMEFTTDTQNPKANTVENRQVSVVYQPTDSSSVLNLETYYNGASYPRSNVCTRDRGTGFVHSEDVPAATLDMKKTQIQDSEAHGVARALFAGRTLDDMSGTDRHIAVGLSGKQDESGRVTLHTVDIYGVNGGGE